MSNVYSVEGLEKLHKDYIILALKNESNNGVGHTSSEPHVPHSNGHIAFHNSVYLPNFSTNPDGSIIPKQTRTIYNRSDKHQAYWTFKDSNEYNLFLSGSSVSVQTVDDPKYTYRKYALPNGQIQLSGKLDINRIDEMTSIYFEGQYCYVIKKIPTNSHNTNEMLGWVFEKYALNPSGGYTHATRLYQRRIMDVTDATRVEIMRMDSDSILLKLDAFNLQNDYCEFLLLDRQSVETGTAIKRLSQFGKGRRVEQGTGPLKPPTQKMEPAYLFIGADSTKKQFYFTHNNTLFSSNQYLLILNQSRFKNPNVPLGNPLDEFFGLSETEIRAKLQSGERYYDLNQLYGENDGNILTDDGLTYDTSRYRIYVAGGKKSSDFEIEKSTIENVVFISPIRKRWYDKKLEKCCTEMHMGYFTKDGKVGFFLDQEERNRLGENAPKYFQNTSQVSPSTWEICMMASTSYVYDNKYILFDNTNHQIHQFRIVSNE